MEKKKFRLFKPSESGGQLALRGGTYSLAVSALVLAILLAQLLNNKDLKPWCGPACWW